MKVWKAEFLFVQASNKAVAKRYHYFSRSSTNTGQTSSFLELASNSDEELVEYFRIAGVFYSKQLLLSGTVQLATF